MSLGLTDLGRLVGQQISRIFGSLALRLQAHIALSFSWGYQDIKHLETESTLQPPGSVFLFSIYKIKHGRAVLDIFNLELS